MAQSREEIARGRLGGGGLSGQHRAGGGDGAVTGADERSAGIENAIHVNAVVAAAAVAARAGDAEDAGGVQRAVQEIHAGVSGAGGGSTGDTDQGNIPAVCSFHRG